MQLILYYAPNACSLVPYVTLTEAGAPFEVHPLNFRKSQHMTPEYLRLNPKHKVPVLVINGAPLTENVAIQIWIARHFPAAKLLPADPMQELHAISLLAWCASGIHPFLSRINSPPRVCDLPGAEASVRRLAQQQLFENYQIADASLPVANGSSTNPPPSTPTSSGAFDAIQPRSFAIQQLRGAFRADAAASQRAKIARLRARGADRVRPGRLI
jgi:glutathione S-transferase